MSNKAGKQEFDAWSRNMDDWLAKREARAKRRRRTAARKEP